MKQRARLVYDLYFSMAQAFAGRKVVPGEAGEGRRAYHTSKNWQAFEKRLDDTERF